MSVGRRLTLTLLVLLLGDDLDLDLDSVNLDLFAGWPSSVQPSSSSQALVENPRMRDLNFRVCFHLRFQFQFRRHPNYVCPHRADCILVLFILSFFSWAFLK